MSTRARSAIFRPSSFICWSAGIVTLPSIVLLHFRGRLLRAARPATAEASTVLATTTLALADGYEGVKFAAGPIVKPKHDAAYWAKVTGGFDFSEADQVPTAEFNRVLWTGLMGSKPYPALRGQPATTKDDDRR
jgi:hypothetical protein